MLDHMESAETGHLQEKPGGVNRGQSESKGFISSVEYRKLMVSYNPTGTPRRFENRSMFTFGVLLICYAPG